MAEKDKEKNIEKTEVSQKLNKKIDAKNDKKKNEKAIKYRSEEQKEVIHFVIILVSIFVIVGVVYGVSRLFIKNNNKAAETDVVAGSINYDVATVGTMFNRPEDEYYVAIYKSSVANAIWYSSILNTYTSKTDALHVYFCDLENTFNEQYYAKDGNSNPKAKTINDVSFGDFTFVKISKGKITKYIENIDDVKKELNV